MNQKLKVMFKLKNSKNNKSYIPEGQEIFKENLNNIKNNDKISDKILLEGNKESYLPLSFRIINNQPYINSKGRNNFIFKNILLKKNII